MQSIGAAFEAGIRARKRHGDGFAPSLGAVSSHPKRVIGSSPHCSGPTGSINT
jgi:hypothetical protein